MFFVKTPTESSSSSGAPHRFIACYSACDAESKDPGGAFRTDAAGGFSANEAREQHPGTPLPQPEFRIPTRGTILSNPNHSGLHTFP